MSWKLIQGVQPAYLLEESEALSEIVKTHPDFMVALQKRGIDDVNQVSVEGLCVANFAEPDEAHLRLSRAHCFYVESPEDNPHVRPIEGLVPVVDMNAMRVLRIEDSGCVPIPPNRGDYRQRRLDNIKPALSQLDITQPNGGLCCQWLSS